MLFLKVCKVPSLHLFRCSQQIHSYFITGAASNLKHEFGDSGKELFTSQDLVVRLEDVIEFTKFLNFCYKMLVLKKSNDSDKWGFCRINGGPVMPYIVRNNSTLRARRITSC